MQQHVAKFLAAAARPEARLVGWSASAQGGAGPHGMATLALAVRGPAVVGPAASFAPATPEKKKTELWSPCCGLQSFKLPLFHGRRENCLHPLGKCPTAKTLNQG